MKKWMPAAVLAMVMLTSACGEKKYTAQPINEEIDICAVCNMQVVDGVYATQLTMADGKNYKFDDIGCMEQWEQEHANEKLGMDFVRDYNDKTWIERGEATYVYDESIRTPMAYGIISFKDKKSAEAYVAKEGVGKIMTAKELEAHDWKQNMDMMNMGHDHGSDDSHNMDGMDGHDSKGMDMDGKKTESSDHK